MGMSSFHTGFVTDEESATEAYLAHRELKAQEVRY